MVKGPTGPGCHMPLLLFQGYFHSMCQLALPIYSLETRLWNMMSSRVIIWRHLNYDCAGLPSIRLYINVLTCFWEGGLIDFITKWHFNIRPVQIICPPIESAGSCFVDTDFSSILRLGFSLCPVFQCTGACVLLFFGGLDRYRVEKTAAMGAKCSLSQSRHCSVTWGLKLSSPFYWFKENCCTRVHLVVGWVLC